MLMALSHVPFRQQFRSPSVPSLPFGHFLPCSGERMECGVFNDSFFFVILNSMSFFLADKADYSGKIWP